MKKAPPIITELTLQLTTGEELVVHVTAEDAIRFHKRMENYIAGRKNRTDNYSMHVLNKSLVVTSASILYYKASRIDGNTFEFALTPAG